jgi:hypothetical protein
MPGTAYYPITPFAAYNSSFEHAFVWHKIENEIGKANPLYVAENKLVLA